MNNLYGVIDSFSGRYRFLSNFYSCEITYKGITYPSSEHAYQAQKCADEGAKHHIVTLTPGQSKRFTKLPAVCIVSDWSKPKKLAEMYGILKVKFSIPELEELLMSTYPNILVEGNTWGDTFWGVCDGVGSNHLGRMLESIRSTKVDPIEGVGR